MLEDMNFPCLKRLSIRLVIGADMEDKGLSELLNKFQGLQNIELDLVYLN